MELVVRTRGADHKVKVERDGHRAVVKLDGEVIELEVCEPAEHLRSLIVGGRQYEVAVKGLGGDRFEVSGSFGVEVVAVLDPLTHLAQTTHDRQSAGGPERITAYMPGRVVDVLVAEGDVVGAGGGVMILEAMKMENEIQSEREGTIRKLFVSRGQAVDRGDLLFEID